MAVANSSGSVSPKAFTGNGNYTWNCGNNDSPLLLLTLSGGNVNLTFSNLVNGATGTIIISQDATGGRSLAFTNAYTYLLGEGFIKSLPSSVSILSFIFNNGVFYYTVTGERKEAEFHFSENAFSASMLKKRTIKSFSKVSDRFYFSLIWSPNLLAPNDASNYWTLNLYAKVSGTFSLVGSVNTANAGIGDNLIITGNLGYQVFNSSQIAIELVKTLGNPGNITLGQVNVFYQE